MTNDTPSPLETIRQRWARATPGPWRVAPQATWWQVKAADPLETLAEPSRIEDAEAIARAPADVAWLLAEVERLQSAPRATEHEVCQTLGAALGYPHDPEGSGICVGDHVAGSLAMEAAERVRQLRAALDAEGYEVRGRP